MNKSYNNIINTTNFVLSDNHNNGNDSNYYYNSNPLLSTKNEKSNKKVAMKSRIGTSDKFCHYPINFEPRSIDVIVGKGMNCYNHVGNKMLRNTIVASRLIEYAATTSKKEKSLVVTSILELVRQNGGAFVKKDYETGLWYDAEPFLARDKISQTIRNALRLNTNKNKVKKRNREQQQQDQKQHQNTRKKLKQTIETNINDITSSTSFLFGNNISNQNIMPYSQYPSLSNNKTTNESIRNAILTGNNGSSEGNRHSNQNILAYSPYSSFSNNRIENERILNAMSTGSIENNSNTLFNFFENYVMSKKNEAVTRDNPFEPNPVNMS